MFIDQSICEMIYDNLSSAFEWGDYLDLLSECSVHIGEHVSCDDNDVVLKNTIIVMDIKFEMRGSHHNIVLRTQYSVKNRFLWRNPQLTVISITGFSAIDGGYIFAV